MDFFLLICTVVAVVAAIRSLWSPCGLSMLTSITPFTERSKGHRYPLTASWFVIGALAGGALLGTLGAIGAAAVAALPGVGWILPAGIVMAVIGTASDLRLGGFHLPLVPRQVDETWLRKYRRWVYAAGFGVQIGSGFATYVMTGAVYLTLALAMLTGSPLTAFRICLLFGGARGLAVLVGAIARTPAGLRQLLSRVDRAAPLSQGVAVATQVWAAVALLGLMVGLPVIGLVVGVVPAAALGIVTTRSPAPFAPTAAPSSTPASSAERPRQLDAAVS